MHFSSTCHPSKRQCACFHQRQNGSQQLPCQSWWNIPYLSGLWDLAIKLPIAGVVCSQTWLFLIPFYDLVHKYIMLTYLTQWNLKHSTWCPFSNRMNTDFGNILRHFQGQWKMTIVKTQRICVTHVKFHRIPVPLEHKKLQPNSSKWWFRK